MTEKELAKILYALIKTFEQEGEILFRKLVHSIIK